MRFRMKPNTGKHRILRSGKDITVRAGEIIDCTKDDLGCAIDKFDQLDADPLPSTSEFKLVPLGTGHYDVIHPATGAAINSKKLRKTEAEALAGMTVEEYDAKEAAKIGEEEGAR